MWADEAAASFGGLEIVTVDAIHCADTGKEWILEMNGTSSGLLPSRKDEDNAHIRDVVLARMREVWLTEARAARRARARCVAIAFLRRPRFQTTVHGAAGVH